MKTITTYNKGRKIMITAMRQTLRKITNTESTISELATLPPKYNTKPLIDQLQLELDSLRATLARQQADNSETLNYVVGEDDYEAETMHGNWFTQLPSKIKAIRNKTTN
jgi:hypothetical protein